MTETQVIDQTLPEEQPDSKSLLTFLLQLGLILVCFYLYSQMDGALFALFTMFGIFIHELGHKIGFQKSNIGSTIYFVPYFGALTKAKREKQIPEIELGKISLNGLQSGLIIIFIYIGIYLITQNQHLFNSLTYLLLLGFLNLLPFSFVDGGQALLSIIKVKNKKITQSILFIFFSISIIVLFLAHEVFFASITIIAGITTIKSISKEKHTYLSTKERVELITSDLWVWTFTLGAILILFKYANWLHFLRLAEFLK